MEILQDAIFLLGLEKVNLSILILFYGAFGSLTWYWVYFRNCTVRRSMYPIHDPRFMIPFRCFWHDIRSNLSESYRTKYIQEFAEGKRGACAGATEIWYFLCIRTSPEEARRAGNDVLGGWGGLVPPIFIGFLWPIALPLMLISIALRNSHKKLQQSWTEDEIKRGVVGRRPPLIRPMFWNIMEDD